MLKETLTIEINTELKFDDDLLYSLKNIGNTVEAIATSKDVVMSINEYKELIARLQAWINEIEKTTNPQKELIEQIDKISFVQKNSGWNFDLDIGDLKIKHNYLSSSNEIEIKTRQAFTISWGAFLFFVKLQDQLIDYINREF